MLSKLCVKKDLEYFPLCLRNLGFVHPWENVNKMDYGWNNRSNFDCLEKLRINWRWSHCESVSFDFDYYYWNDQEIRSQRCIAYQVPNYPNSWWSFYRGSRILWITQLHIFQVQRSQSKSPLCGCWTSTWQSPFVSPWWTLLVSILSEIDTLSDQVSTEH